MASRTSLLRPATVSARRPADGLCANMAARAMKTNRTYNLGVLFVDERQSGLAHEYFSAVLDSFKVQVEKLGYDITFVNRNLGGRTMTYLEHSTTGALTER